MSTTASYQQYVANDQHMKEYSNYQKRYATKLRESDRVIIELIQGIVDKNENGRPLTLLDIGCSTGNLLLHLKQMLPGLSLVGGDLARDVIEECKQNLELQGIEFCQLDVTQLSMDRKFDFVVANAVLGVLDEDEFDEAIKCIANALNDNGFLLVFDWFHPFEQQLTISEKSACIPNGLTWRARGFDRVEQCLVKHGLTDATFTPFFMGFDLEQPTDRLSIQTYTVRTDAGKRLSFRGAFCQPWCHLAVQKR